MESNLTEAEKAEHLQKFQEYWKAKDWSGTFMQHVSTCKPISIEPGKVSFEFTVTKEFLNLIGTLHGGASSALFDSIMRFCLWLPEVIVPQITVTVDLFITFVTAARLNDVLIIDANVIAIRNNLLFLRGKITFKENGKLVASAKQTLAMINLTKQRQLSKDVEKISIDQSEVTIPEFNNDFLEAKKFDWSYWVSPTGGVSFSIFAKGCELIDARPGHFFFEFTINKEHCDTNSKLSGGCLSTLIDICTSHTSSSFHTDHRVTANLAISFIGSAKIGDTIIIETKCPKEGKNVVYLSAHVYKKHNKNTVAIAHQTMILMELQRILQKARM